MGNLLQGFVNQAIAIATSIVLLMAIISVVRTWWRAGAQVTVTVVGAVVLAALVIWGVLNFRFLEGLTDEEVDRHTTGNPHSPPITLDRSGR